MPIRRFNRNTAGRVILTLFALVTAWVAQVPAYAQDSSEYSEDLFYTLLDERDESLDAARAAVANEFDEYEAAEIAAYLCAPDPDRACEGSDVLAAWHEFLDGLYDGRSVYANVIDMSESDEFLAIAIMVYWCTPPAGYGCEDDEDDEDDEYDEYNENGEYDEYDEYDGRQSDFAEEDQVKERPVSRASRAQYFGGGKRKSRTRK